MLLPRPIDLFPSLVRTVSSVELPELLLRPGSEIPSSSPVYCHHGVLETWCLPPIYYVTNVIIICLETIQRDVDIRLPLFALTLMHKVIYY